MQSTPYRASIDGVRIFTQGTPPALMHPAFGKFLDRANNAPLDKATCNTLLELIRVMSASYLDTTGDSVLKLSRLVFGEQHKGKARGQELERAQLFRMPLLKLMQRIMRNKPTTLEPASVSLVRSAQW